MPHHIHFLVSTPEGMAISALVRRIKANSARRFKLMLSEGTDSEFNEQRGLNRRQVWQRSFRSFVVEAEEIFKQKRTYIHANPVRAELVRNELNYRWSSVHCYERGEFSGEFELDLDAIIAEFAPDGLPSVSNVSKR